MITGGQKPKRNQPCPCGSELKYKWCHGDVIKVADARDAMNRRMAELIIEEKIMRGLLDPSDLDTETGFGMDEGPELEPEPSPIIIP